MIARPGQVGRPKGVKKILDDIAEGNAPEPEFEAWNGEFMTRPERVIYFLEHLPITKGKLLGTNMRLLPQQKAWVHRIYGSLDANGRRITRVAVQSLPRGNGKTGFIAGLMLCHLLGPEAEDRGECYSAAIDRGQAAIMFTEMEAMLFKRPKLRARCNLSRFHKKIEVIRGKGLFSTYEALSNDARRGHGIAPSFWAYDELAQAKDGELLDNLLTAMGKRNEPLAVVLSTQAPNNDHPLSKLIDDGLTRVDPTIDVELFAAEPDADIFDEKVWLACNPAWGIFLDETDFRSKAARAKRIPSFEPAFRNLHLNQRVDAQAEMRIVSPAVWRMGAQPVQELRGRAVYAGLDLSGKHDLTAFVLVAERDKTGKMDVLPFFWTPEGQLDKRSHNEEQLFRQWISDGFMIPVPGPVVDLAYVAQQVFRICLDYEIKAVGFDRWRIDELLHHIKLVAETQDIETQIKFELGTKFEPFGQGYKDMAPAVEHFQEVTSQAILRHGGHPVLNACVTNAILSNPDDAGNYKFAKGKANESAMVRIDGIVAAAMALGIMRRMQASDLGPSIYERRGLVEAEGIMT